ncbi:hypothetical protein HYT01_02725 [Candidatus Giovannonibacteria bacterium]|nr:hypothetical protein [Candidatus Giovannonibacteria bacterium]
MSKSKRLKKAEGSKRNRSQLEKENAYLIQNIKLLKEHIKCADLAFGVASAKLFERDVAEGLYDYAKGT